MLKFIFLVGRTLIDETNFYAYIDSRLLFLLNQFGAKIDFRNYNAIKEDIIKNRKLEILCQYFKIGIIANQDKKILKILEFHDLGKNFHSCILSFGSNTEHDKEILGLVLEMMKKRATECIMIDDRLDRYMQHANILGMITIRLNSIFNL